MALEKKQSPSGSASAIITSPDLHHHTEDEQLEAMGYKQEMVRNLGLVSVLGLAFAIMAPMLGTSTAISIALVNGGPVTMVWGWVFVSLVSLAIAASLGEICSVYPTSGGVYYWAACLSTPKWAPIASYLTGWTGLVGNWTVTLSINFSGAQLILAAITLWNENYVPTAWQTVLCFWACMLMSTVINVVFNRHLDRLNTVCLYWSAATLIVVVTLFAKCKDLHSASFAFGHYDASSSGWPSGWSFFVGLLQAAYTLTGYGMTASLCEEVNHPEREVPRAMVLSVVAAAFTGLLYLISLNFTLPDIEMLLTVASLQPIPLFFKTVTGSAAGGFGLLFLVLGVWAFSAIGSLTAASRCTWAFSRDGGIPLSPMWSKIRFGLPFNALLLSSAVISLLGLIYLGSSAAFAAFTGVATINLGASYAFPIACSLARKRHLVRDAPYSLGKFGFVINIICVSWILLSIVLFCMPTAIPVTPSTMNWASVVFAGFFLIAAVWYFAWARKNYTGPPVHFNPNTGEALVPGEHGVMGGEKAALEQSNGTLDDHSAGLSRSH